MYKTSKPILSFVLTVCLVICLWLIGSQRSNAQRFIPGADQIQQLINRLDQTVTDFRGSIGQYQQKIGEYETKINAYDERVTATINGIEGKVQTEIDGISGRVEDEIQSIRGEIDASIQAIESRIVKTISSLGWGLLIGDSFVSALFSGLATWWVTRRLRRTVKTQLEELNQTFQQGVNTAVNRGEAAAQTVTDGISQSNVFAMMQGLQAENQQILKMLRDLKNE